jgi:hypothetical protein
VSVRRLNVRRLSVSENENADQYRSAGRRARGWRNDPALVRVHHAALAVECRYCHAAPSVACFHPHDPEHHPLLNLPCHPVRETDSQRGPTRDA